MSRILKRFGAASFMIVGLLIVANTLSGWYLRRQSRRYHEEIGEIRQRETSYRRPMLFGEPLPQNAAVWYRQAWPHLTTTSVEQLRPALAAGFAGYDDRFTTLIVERCREGRSTRVRNALRATFCDWELGFGASSLVPFDHWREALVLGDCLTIEGHRAAHAGDFSGAARVYLAAVSVGADLAMGTDNMASVGLGDARMGLQALAKLVSTASDRQFLREVAKDLSRFEGHLPDVRLGLWRVRLWFENGLPLDELETRGDRFTGLGRTAQIRAALRLWQGQPAMRGLERLAAITQRAEGLQLTQQLTNISVRSRIDLVREMDLGYFGRQVLRGMDLGGVYQATQAAITLQRWRIEHGTYPLDPSALGPIRLALTTNGIRYELFSDGSGYKLVGPNGTLFERTP